MYKHVALSLLFLYLFFSGCTSPTDNDSGVLPPALIPPQIYYNPIWHPNGNFIAFNYRPLKSLHYTNDESTFPDKWEFRGDSSGFWSINPNGTGLNRIFPYKLLRPSWSPDGKWLTFNSGAQICKMEFTGTSFDTNNVIQLTSGSRSFSPAWSPDGEFIAFDSDMDSPNGAKFIWTMKSDGSNKRRIAYDPSKGEIRMPGWSPDGKKIVHIRYLPGVFGSQIFVMDSSGSNPTRLTFSNSVDESPRYSPDGKYIAFTSQPKNSQVNLWLMDSDGNNPRQLTTEGIEVDEGDPFSWDPTGRYIVYTKYRWDKWPVQNSTLWIYDITTGQQRQLTFNLKQ